MSSVLSKGILPYKPHIKVKPSNITLFIYEFNPK